MGQQEYRFPVGAVYRQRNAWGKAWQRGSVSLVGTYFDSGRLNSQERVVSSDPTIGETRTQCNPGNVYSTTGANLPGLGSTSAAVVAGEHNSPGSSDFLAGQLNRCRYSYASDLIPEAERATAYAAGRFEASPSVELFSELMLTHQKQRFSEGHHRLTSVLVPASNAYNPFGEAVRVDYRLIEPEAEYLERNATDFRRTLVGARGSLPGHWQWELAAWEARDTTDYTDGAYIENSANLAAALASSDPATALNLFTSGRPASDAVLASLYTSPQIFASGRNQIANGFIKGELFPLPAGAVSAVVGGEYVRTRLQLKYTDPQYAASNLDFSRTSSSLYSEVRVPILANRAREGAGELLAFTSAIRFEHYDDFGSKLVPQYALEWRPSRSLLLRAAYAEAFKAPNLNNLHAPRGTVQGYCCVFDPKHGNASTTYDLIYGGNENLQPESGESRSAGLVWSPHALSGLDLSFTWWQIDERDRASSLGLQAIVDNEASFPNLVIRDPVTGAIEAVDATYVNFGELNVAGFDMGVSYRWQTPIGIFTPSLSATDIYRYDAALSPGAPAFDRLNNPTSTEGWAPRWKASTALLWTQGAYSARVGGRYVGRYNDYEDLGPTSRELGNVWLWDISGRVALGAALGSTNSYLKSSFVQVTAVNVLQPRPQYSAFFYGTAGYDASQYDARGRFISVSFGVSF
ncbi:MAG: TonB-dependent receptor [Gammaproteobacteria bacterium]